LEKENHYIIQNQEKDFKMKIKIILPLLLLLIGLVSAGEITISPESVGYHLCFYKGDGILDKCITTFNSSINLSLNDYYIKLDYGSNNLTIQETPVQMLFVFKDFILPLVAVFLVLLTI
jgi:hypothetical protein